MNAKTRNFLVRCCPAVGLCALLLLAGGLPLQAQNGPRPTGVNRLAHLNSLAAKFSPGMEQRLSAGGANMFHMAKVLSDSKVMGATDMTSAREALHKALAGSAARAQAAALAPEASSAQAKPVQVNDSSLDYVVSRVAGFTQSETSSAWCGNNVVVGFNDSGADIRSVIEQVGGASFSGVGFSQNGGRSFTGLPFLNPGTDPGTFLGGDPVVACSDASHFLYASLLSHITVDSNGNVLTATAGISINRSSSGGQTWDSPITAVGKDGFSDFLDKEWMAIDVKHPNNIYVTYTDFDFALSDPKCPAVTPGRVLGPDIRVEIVSSKDGGNTWSNPNVLARLCNAGNLDNLSGSQVVVGPSGEVYVVYARVFEGRVAHLHVRTSTNGGRSFGPPVLVSNARAASAAGAFLQGGFRTNAFPALAVDNFPGPDRGTLYMAWTDASHNTVADFLTFDGSPYAFGDIVLSTSRDGGQSWSTPTVVSPTPKDFAGAGRDQFMAGVAVDVSGNVAVCYSDRRQDPGNFLVDHYCSVSHDQGATFGDVRETRSSWVPSHNTDFLINPRYLGDYDTVSSDALGSKAGFFNTFQIQNNGNPDVFGFRLAF